MTWDHAQLGKLDPLLHDLQPQKVWKHLFAAAERWSDLLGLEVAKLEADARRAGCPRPPEEGGREGFSPGCREVLRGIHDAHWMGAYSAEIFAPASRAAKKRYGERWMIDTPRGVLVVVVPVRGAVPFAILTVYRPHDPGSSVPPDEAHFVRQARRAWEQETGMRSDVVKSWLLEPAHDATGVWMLAHAVAMARAAGVGAEQVQDAVDRLTALPAAARAQAVPDADRLCDHLESALQVDDAVEAEFVLVDLANAIAVTDVLAGDRAAAALLDRLTALLDWAPEGWAELGASAASRQQDLAGVVATWWGEVADRLLAPLLVEARRPGVATIASSMFAGAPPTLWDRLQRWLVSSTIQPDGWFVGATELGGTHGDWDVRPPAELRRAPRVRLFAVEGDEASPEDLTDLLRQGGPVWTFERPGQDLVIVIVHDADHGDLATLLDAADPDDVRVFRLSRPK